MNGSVPLPKNPVDCAEDEACEPIDLAMSHAADAAPKAISMIKTSSMPHPRGRCVYYQLSASVVPDKKRNKSAALRTEQTSQGRQMLPRRQDLPIQGLVLSHCRRALLMLGEDRLACS